MRVLAGLLWLFAVAAAAPAADVQPDAKLRYNRNTYHPVMEVLKERRAKPVAADKLEALKTLPFESIWGTLRRLGYVNASFTGLKTTQPDARMVGRALTIRYLPRRPDLVEAMQELAKGGDWPTGYHVRAGEEAKPGDVLVVDLGGGIPDGVFFGDISALAARVRGAKGAILYGASRDLAELRAMKDFPVYAMGFDPMPATQIGVDWNVPIRVGGATVLPGDIVVAEEEAVLFFPPELLDQVVEQTREHAAQEEYERELVRQNKYRFRDVYPLNPELRKKFEEERKKRQ
jgi:regulator of RNase E activity RraA